MNKLLHKFSSYNSFEKIYDTHAANMYGCIYKIVQNKLQAEKILTSVFEEFVNDKSGNIEKIATPVWYIKYAMKKTFAYLKEAEINNELSPFIKERIIAFKKEITQPCLPKQKLQVSL